MDQSIAPQSPDPTPRQQQTLKRRSLSGLLNLPLLRGNSVSPKRFKLLRYFSIVSLSAFALATALLAVLYRQQALHNLVSLQEESNVALAQVFSNTLWQDYGVFLSSTQALSVERLAAHPKTYQLHEEIVAQVRGLSVAKVKIYDLQGRTVFSTDMSQIGQDKHRSPGFLTAKSGKVISQLEHRETFKALQTTVNNRHLFSSYIPIRAAGAKAEIVGVFELYTDVTPLLRKINQTQRHIVFDSLLILTVLYGVLFAFVYKANGLLKQQYRQLQDSEVHYRQQADNLESTLSELRQAQVQMIQSEKMSGLGQMVAGVAHEINNPVNFIHGNLSHVDQYTHELINLIQRYQVHYPNPPQELQADLESADLGFLVDDLARILKSMKVGTDRIREIVLSLRNFSRLDESAFKPVNIHEGINNTLVILGHRLKARTERPAIQVIKEYSQLPLVECYAGQLNQVFMNVLSNAIDALEESNRGKSFQEVLANPNKIEIHTRRVSDQQVAIAITDNGSGIPEHVRSRLFDPFFTTKTVGKGTGLGLFISHQIVTQKHGGNLWCDSTPGQGTTFVIEIPIQQKEIAC